MTRYRSQDNLFQLWRDFGVQRRRRTHRSGNNGLRQFRQGATGEGTLSRQHLIKYNAERVDVAAVIQRMPPALFWGGIVNTADQCLRDGDLLVSWRARQAKIHYLNLAPPVQHQVFRLDIAMNDVALFIGNIKRVSNLRGILDGEMLWHDG